MGKLRNRVITEQRIYDDPKHPESSDYDVTLPQTVLKAVHDPESGETLDVTIVRIFEYSSDVLAQVLAELAAHNTAPQSHPDLRGAQRDMDSRLALLELLFNTDVSGNPFTATFETLTGLTAQGVWNAALNRLEF